MSSSTSHYNLTKPAYDESADIAVINSNMDIIDTQMYKNAQGVSKLDESIAIVSNNNTHVAISAGQYVYVKNHSTLSEGLYTATSAIAANAALSTSNLAAVSGGGLNALNSKIGELNSDGNTTRDVLASAESCTTTTFYNGSGGSYTGSLPSGADNSFRWSTFMVNVKGTIKTVIALSPENKMYINVYDTGAWKGWETLAKNSDIANIRKVIVGEADITTSSNGNFSITGLSSSSFMLLAITVTSPDDVIAIPYKYGTGAGLLGGHAMSCLAAQTAVTNVNLHIKYAYVAI